MSRLEELSTGDFRAVIDDRRRGADRILLCSGKVYYDLLAARDELQADSVALVRVEQLYPFPQREIREALEFHDNPKQVTWVQEEPQNRGAWLFMSDRFRRSFPDVDMTYIGRPESASPATGSHARHEREQRQLVRWALTGADSAPEEIATEHSVA